MSSIKITEADFREIKIIDISKDKRLKWALNSAGILSFGVFYIFFFYIENAINPVYNCGMLIPAKSFFDNSSDLSIVFVFVLLAVMVIHELIHGLFFYIFTKEKPAFGFKHTFAYAGAPLWFISKSRYYYVTLSPLIIISLAGILLMQISPSEISYFIFMTVSAHAAGCVGDIWISLYLLKMPGKSYINDTGLTAKIGY